MEKKKVIVVGCNGRMGKLVCQAISNSEEFTTVAGYDKKDLGIHPFPVFSYVKDINISADLIIDFSHPTATMEALSFAAEHGIPMVIATTGFTDEQEKRINEYYSEHVPIFKSSNMSYGVNVVCHLLKVAAPLLCNYDVSIIESHHRNKKDAPSGTAKMFFETIDNAHPFVLTPSYGSADKKNSDEVWIASERGGAIAGEHRITFAGDNDFIRIEHFAHNPYIFAEGALDAATYLMEQTEPAIYTMEDLF